MPRRNNDSYQHDASGSAPSIDNASFLQQAQALIPAEVRMISGCEDNQTSADVIRSSHGTCLPNPRGRAGGACTNVLLELLHQRPKLSKQKELTFQQVLQQLREKLAQQGYSQIPQLTSSRPLELDETPFTLIGSPTGARRALLVGINYCGQEGQLRGCHNDVYHMQDYLIQVQGFPPQDILVLMDDVGGKHHAPSREKIIRALRHLVAVSEPGDAVFFHYSGHGGLLSPDFNSFKYKQQQSTSFFSCYDQTLIPVDHTYSGQIRDFSLFHHFVQPMKAGVVVTCLMDCCHSASVLDLPYSFRPTNVGERHERGHYGMSQNMASMSNLAFLYILAGGTLPYGIFDNVTHHLQNTVDGNLEDYQGSMVDALDHDTNDAYDYEGDLDGAAAVGDTDGTFGDGLDGTNDLDATGMTETDADYSNIVAGEEVARSFDGNGGGGYYANDQLFTDPPQQGFESGDGGFDSGTVGDEGCGDEGCGDILSTLADCLNDEG